MLAGDVRRANSLRASLFPPAGRAVPPRRKVRGRRLMGHVSRVALDGFEVNRLQVVAAPTRIGSSFTADSGSGAVVAPSSRAAIHQLRRNRKLVPSTRRVARMSAPLLMPTPN